MIIIGYEEIKYFSKKQNKQIEGTVYYLGRQIDNGDGVKFEAQWFYGGYDLFDVGEEVEALYSKYGYVKEVRRV